MWCEKTAKKFFKKRNKKWKHSRWGVCESTSVGCWDWKCSFTDSQSEHPKDVQIKNMF